MPLISSSCAAVRPRCQDCCSESTISFNWRYAQTTTRPEHRRDLEAFVDPRPLRFGTLYRCRTCHRPWYLDGEPPFMNYVPADRLPLIERWNEEPVALSGEHLTELAGIGRTPPGLSVRARLCEIPCSVTTRNQERIDLAVLSFQSHAPFEEWRDYRLASDIVELRPSRYALPLPVRTATAQAGEIKMGLAPTVVELPDGKHLAFNGPQQFWISDACEAGEVVLSRRRFDLSNPLPMADWPVRMVYFAADPVDRFRI